MLDDDELNDSWWLFGVLGNLHGWTGWTGCLFGRRGNRVALPPFHPHPSPLPSRERRFASLRPGHPPLASRAGLKPAPTLCASPYASRRGHGLEQKRDAPDRGIGSVRPGDTIFRGGMHCIIRQVRYGCQKLFLGRLIPLRWLPQRKP